MPTTRVYCRAAAIPSPNATANGLCGYPLYDGPELGDFVSIAKRAPDEPDGYTRLKCGRCGLWNVYTAARAQARSA
jgi:hypothetical protein